MKLSCGNWVDGERFWDRKDDMVLLRKRIEEGNHILLVAQRRMGKTSLMHELARQVGGRFTCLFVDVQKAATAADAVVELSLATRQVKSLWGKTRDLFANILGQIAENVEEVTINDLGFKLRGGLNAGNWSEKGDQLFSILAASDKPVLLLMDEVPILVNRLLKNENGEVTPDGKKLADQFMSWLRANSIKHQGRVRIILSGSIGLEPVLNQAGLSASLNTFSPFELKPWDEPTAEGCLNELAAEYGIKFAPGATTEIVKRLGCCIPHHVQMFFSHIHDRCIRRKRMEFFKDEVDEIYTSEMLSIRGHAELTHYEERLKLVLGEKRFPLASEMLTEAAVSGKLGKDALAALRKLYPDVGGSEAQREILQVLEHDGYLRIENGEYTFVSRLLRDWWRKRNELFFVPILERSI